jgi:hypothetical protein
LEVYPDGEDGLLGLLKIRIPHYHNWFYLLRTCRWGFK